MELLTRKGHIGSEADDWGPLLGMTSELFGEPLKPRALRSAGRLQRSQPGSIFE